MYNFCLCGINNVNDKLNKLCGLVVCQLDHYIKFIDNDLKRYDANYNGTTSQIMSEIPDKIIYNIANNFSENIFGIKLEQLIMDGNDITLKFTLKDECGQIFYTRYVHLNIHMIMR